MSERRRSLYEVKKTVPKPKTCIEKKAESESSSSNEDVKPTRKSKAKGGPAYNYYYGPQTQPTLQQERLNVPNLLW